MAEHRTTVGKSGAKAGTPVFCTTQWTQVLAARGDSEPARLALSELCGAYYEPIMAFLTRAGHDPATSRELAHEFFARLLQGGSLANVRPEGRFRSYLLGALKHFLSHHYAREHRLKRGGGREAVSLDAGTDTTPELALPDPVTLSPDAAYDRQWATTVLSRALAALRRECEAEGRGAQFERLKPWLTGEAEHGDQAEMARALGLETQGLKSAVHRLKARFRRLVKQEIGSTLSTPEDIEEEMRASQQSSEKPVEPETSQVGGSPERAAQRAGPAGTDPALADVADIMAEERFAAGDTNKHYFLISKPADTQPPATGYGLLLVLPGGDGGADFQPFLKRICKRAVPEGFLVVQLVAPRWDPEQARSLVWPTLANRAAAKFTTEQFIGAVVADLAAQRAINARRVFTLSWSSGGPAAYAASLQENVPAAASPP